MDSTTDEFPDLRDWHDEGPTEFLPAGDECGVPGCDHPEVYASNGLCPVHSAMIREVAEFLGWDDQRQVWLPDSTFDCWRSLP